MNVPARIKIFAVSTLTLLNYPSVAQTVSSSPYSLYGIGTLLGKSSALNRSLSGTGIAIRDPLNLNNSNPASYTSIRDPTQIFEMGFFVESDRYYTTDESTTSSAGNLTSLNAWFRFSRRWAGAVGISPYSNMDYAIAARRKIGVGEGSSIQYSGSGGISQFYFGNGFQLTKNLSLGITGSYIFGSLEKNEEVTSGLGAGILYTDRIHVNELNLDFGAQYTFFLKNDTRLSVGITYDDPLTLNTSAERYALLLSDTLFYESNRVDDYLLPTSYGFGMSLATLRSTFAADLTYKEWSGAMLDTDTKLQDTFGLSMGYEYKGNPDADSYWEILQLRAGLYIRENYLVLGSQTFADWGWSLGIGFPVNGNRGAVNFTYNHNQTGTLNNDLIKYQNHVFSLEFTFRDIWGVRRMSE